MCGYARRCVARRNGAGPLVLVGVHNLRTIDAECGTMKYTSDVTMRGSAKQRAVSLRITGRCASVRAKSALCLLHAIILVFFSFRCARGVWWIAVTIADFRSRTPPPHLSDITLRNNFSPSCPSITGTYLRVDIIFQHLLYNCNRSP